MRFKAYLPIELSIFNSKFITHGKEGIHLTHLIVVVVFFDSWNVYKLIFSLKQKVDR